MRFSNTERYYFYTFTVYFLEQNILNIFNLNPNKYSSLKITIHNNYMIITNINDNH